MHIYQNLLSRCLTTFAFGVGHGRQKAIRRRQADRHRRLHLPQRLRLSPAGACTSIPESADGPQELASIGRFASDHGSPAWEPMTIYHNTILADDAGRYDYGTSGLSAGVGRGTRRRVFNNIIVQADELPGSLPAGGEPRLPGRPQPALERQGRPGLPGRALRQVPAVEGLRGEQGPLPGGLDRQDRFADPKFVKYDPDWKGPIDLRLQQGSPAIDSGLSLPADWSDPLKQADAGKPDLGAVPLGAGPCRVGVQGRLTLFGDSVSSAASAFEPAPFLARTGTPLSQKPAALVKGYPAFDADYLEYVHRRQGIPVEVFDRERGWLNPKDYGRYRTVMLVGSLLRAKMEPNKYEGADFEHVRKYLEQGGTLLVMRSGLDPLATPAGREFLASLTGGNPKQTAVTMRIRQADHPWVKHLDAKAEHPWLTSKNVAPLRIDQGNAIIGSADGSQALLYRLPVGKGQLIYVGWEIAESIPHGRLPSTPERERVFEDQIRILRNLADAK